MDVKASVDSPRSIFGYPTRAGSTAGRSGFLESGFGKVHARIIQKVLSMLWERLITPYPRRDNAPLGHVMFNKLDLKTRMRVKRAFGALKRRWQIFDKVLESLNVQQI